MVFEFTLPDVGEGVAEGELVSWLVEPGDPVSEDQPVAEVETDKALAEIPSPVDGTVKELLAEEGDIIPVGDVFITFEVEGEVPDEEVEATGGGEAAGGDGAGGEAAGAEGAGAAAGGNGEEPATPEGRVFAAPSARRLARELGVDIAAVSGSGPGGRVTEADVRAAGEDGAGGGAAAAGGAAGGGEAGGGEAATGTGQMQDAFEGGVSGGETAETATAPAGVEPAGRERTLAAPATRRAAEEEGVDIDDVPASEQRDGEAFVTEAAVREYAEAQQAAQAADAAAEPGAAAPSGAAGGGAAGGAAAGEAPAGGVERVPFRGVRKTISDAMVESKFSAPHVTHHDTAVVDDLVETRERLKPEADERGMRLTYLPFVMKAVVAALKQHPKLNAELDEEAGEILRKHFYNIGVATATDAGLMVPVVEDVDGKGMLQISSEADELVQKARDRSISPDELQGSTFTITNFGAVGGEYATPILNYPEVAILGVGELKQRPVVREEPRSSEGASGEAASGNGEVVAAHTLPISLSIDHRVVDGADAARFANTLIEYLENPDLLLLE